MRQRRVFEMNETTIQLEVLLFGACRESVGVSEMAFTLVAPATVASAWSALEAAHPALSSYERSVLFAVNEEHAQRTQVLNAGDVLAIFPPVSGG
jgi:molybdopterin converting factor subunit 1